MLHNGWRNFDPVHPRKALIVSWVARDVLFGPSLGGLFTRKAETFSEMHASLRHWQPGREHIVPTGKEAHGWPHAPSHAFNGAWDAQASGDTPAQGQGYWPETFLPGHTHVDAAKHSAQSEKRAVAEAKYMARAPPKL